MTGILVVIVIAMIVETPVTIVVGPVVADAIAVVPEKEIVVDMTVTGKPSLLSSRLFYHDTSPIPHLFLLLSWCRIFSIPCTLAIIFILA